MRKTAVALGSVGIGAGILYALGRKRAKNNDRIQSIDDSDIDNVGGRGLEDQEPENLATSERGQWVSPEKLPSMSPQKEGASDMAVDDDYKIDNRGTDQNEAPGTDENQRRSVQFE